ncbi:MAG: arginyl-tRNA synthetase [Candidatus Doudnabacteria bacterium]|nr:arginyl-tRNA synthetase [Candidatus Doudnabacteria bacterium]
MKRYIQKLISEVLSGMLSNGQITALPDFRLDVPKENFGDYTTSVSLAIAREGKFQPNDVAEIIARELEKLDSKQIFKTIKVVNGFINIFISDAAAAQNVLEMQTDIAIEQIGEKPDGTSKKVVFEYSSPNTNKPLHIGHTRNDVYGMANINLLRVTGHEVIATEIINDRGIHIMKSMLMYMKHGEGKTPQSEGLKPDHFVGKFYSMFEQENIKDKPALPSESATLSTDAAVPHAVQTQPTPLENEAQELLQKWEAGDPETRALWQKMNDWFFEGVKATYAREGSEFDEVEKESNIYNQGRDLVLKGVQEKVFQKEEDGSVSVDLTDQGLDKKYLLRKDGTTIYITQDMYLWSLRAEKFNPDVAIVTTSAEQAYHFDVLGKIFVLLKFPWAENFKHLPYEHVFLGKNKMSSRLGNAVSADDLLIMIKARVRETMKASQKIKASVDDDELVEAVAFAAIKYGYLKYDRNTKIYFDLEETIAIEGNTGPYLQYTYARIQSIFEKAREAGTGAFTALAPVSLTEPSEQALIRHLLHYNETVATAAKDFRPTAICNYLFELSSKFNTFYDQVSVLGADSEQKKNERLNLLAAVANNLQHGLALLGIKTVEKM